MRYFTPKEANDFIPALRQAFDQIDRDRYELVQILKDFEAEGGNEVDLETLPVADDLPEPQRQKRLRAKQLMVRIRAIVGDLQSHGLLVKRLDGLVDFRARRGDRPVFLCWRRGEDRIEHWHELTSGAENRRPVDELFKKPALLN
ncbi:MAG: DUF2203 family protein [Myxococcales bacterium]